jgi:hypothetical protein
VFIASCPFWFLTSLSLLVAILFLLDFLKQAKTIRFEKFSEFADAHRQNSSRGSRSAHHYCACDACRAHIPSSELLNRPRLSGPAALPLAAAYARASVPSHSLRFCIPQAPDQTIDVEM